MKKYTKGKYIKMTEAEIKEMKDKLSKIPEPPKASLWTGSKN